MAKRFSITESAGSRCSYSFIVAEDSPIGSWSEAELPDALLGEVESLASGSSAPAFLWAPTGALHFEVSEEL